MKQRDRRERAAQGDGQAIAELAKLTEIEAAERTPVCSICGGLGWVRRVVSLDAPDFGKALPCPACRASVPKLTYLRTRLPVKLRDADQDEDAKPPNATMEELAKKDMAMRAVLAWGVRSVDQKPWLVLVGSWGTGKSHAGARALIERARLGQLGTYIRAPDLLGNLRDSMGEGDYERLIEDYHQCSLLMVDDLGVESFTRWTDEAIYRILDHRYSEELDTIVASNVQPDALEARVADRLVDPTVAEVVRFAWPSYRSGERAAW